RKVCKKGWEKSVQLLIEKINPKLRFTRNYNKIRPYTEYCEEIIELTE
ncbi:nucleoside deaminase, partial [Thermococci archaeon]